MVDICMAQSVSPHTGMRTIQNTVVFWQAVFQPPRPYSLFFGTRLRRQNFNLAPTQYRQLRRLELKLCTMALSSSAATGGNSKGVQVVWLNKSLKLVVEGEILAAGLGPTLEKYLLKLVAMEVGSEISSTLLLKQKG